MQKHTHGHVYRATNVDRIITQYGNKPPEQARQRLTAAMEKEKERFLEAERKRSQQRGHARGR